MRYIKPEEVLSPQTKVSNVRVVYDSGENGWSVARLEWEGVETVGVRWNGGTESGSKFPGMGNPQSRGYPTWFIVPDELEEVVLKVAEELAAKKKRGRPKKA